MIWSFQVKRSRNAYIWHRLATSGRTRCKSSKSVNIAQDTGLSGARKRFHSGGLGGYTVPLSERCRELNAAL